jgi:hypothetical protein
MGPVIGVIAQVLVALSIAGISIAQARRSRLACMPGPRELPCVDAAGSRARAGFLW